MYKILSNKMKLKKFQQFMEKEDIDNTILTNYSDHPNSNFTYFTQIPEINAVLLINKDPTLYVSSLELSIAEQYSKIKNIKKLDKNFLLALRELNPKKSGIDKDAITLNQFKNIKSKLKKVNLVDISKEILDLRLLKTEEEISLIKKSCNFADLLVEKAIDFIKKSKTELEVKNFVEKTIIDLNLKPSFPPIIASNINSKNPHHLSNNTKLKGFTIIDLGVKYKNYCSDITRTVYLGKPKEEEIKIYNNVLEVQEKAINKNSQPRELNNSAVKELGKYLTHSLGHGIGLDVHESPSISQLSKDRFKNKMVFTIEPGYYNKFGIRIEDDFLYSGNKKIQLTKTPKEFLRL